MSPVHDLIRSTLDSVRAHDTDAVRSTVTETTLHIPEGYHPLRYELRAIECAVDIDNWDAAWVHASAALETVCPEEAHRLPRYPDMVGT